MNYLKLDTSWCLEIPDGTEKLKVVWCILHNELPEENFILLKFLMEFLNEVWIRYKSFNFIGWFLNSVTMCHLYLAFAVMRSCQSIERFETGWSLCNYVFVKLQIIFFTSKEQILYIQNNWNLKRPNFCFNILPRSTVGFNNKNAKMYNLVNSVKSWFAFIMISIILKCQYKRAYLTD